MGGWGPGLSPACHLRRVEVNVEGVGASIDGNRVTGSNQCNRTAFLGFRGDMPHDEAVGAA
jgi:hypothetical protein